MIVFLHVGAPKTGTTYLQEMLRQNRTELVSDGVCYPGTGTDHFRAAQDLLDWRFGEDQPVGDGRWAALVAQLRGSGLPRGVISHEILGRAGPSEVERAMADLAFAEVHLVYSVRDLSRMIPAMWQEKIKNREKVSYDDYLANLRRLHEQHRDGTAQFPTHLRGFDLAGTLSNWGRQLPAERVHVVTTPRSGPPDLLWRRFAEVLGVDPERYTADVPTNPSLGQAEAEFLRRLNGVLDKELTWPQYHRVVKHFLAQDALAAGSGSPAVTLPRDQADWVVAWSQDRIDFLTSAGYRVVGDLADLVPAGPFEDHAPADPEQVLEAGARAASALVTALAHRPAPRGQRPDGALPTASPAWAARVRPALIRWAGRRPFTARMLAAARRIRRRA